MPSNRLLELGPKVGQALGVDVSTSQTLVNGLRQIPSDQLQNVTSSVISSVCNEYFCNTTEILNS